MTGKKDPHYLTQKKARDQFFPDSSLKSAAKESFQSSPLADSIDDKKNPGLKKISKSVMEAVVNKGTTTYKEVAHIVSRLNENNPQLFDSSSSGSHSKKKQAN